MLRIMIVDDEFPIRQWFRFCIEKYPGDFKVICEAGDGKEALGLLENNKIDVIITDIRMPKMDGIELMKVVKKAYAEIEIILLTCYEEFDYAKAAISEGAFEYLLKTSIRDKEIIEVLNNVEKAISDRGYSKKSIGLFNRITEEELVNWPIEKKAQLNQQTVIAITLSAKDDVSNLSLVQMLDELELKNAMILYWIELSRQAALVIFKLEPQKVQSDDVKTVENLIEKVSNYKFKVALSTIHYNFDGMKQAIYEAKLATNSFFYYHQQNLMRYNSNLEIKIDKNLIKKLLNDFLTCELKEDSSGVVQNAKEIMSIIKKTRCLDINYIYNTVYIMINILMNSNHSSHDYEGVGLRDLVLEKTTFNDLETFLFTEIDKHISIATQLGSENIAIKKSVDYINDNFMKQLTLGKVARYVHLNPEYFSRLFHEVMGVKFSHYLSNKRLETAMRLYESTDMKLYQIGEEVGYCNYSYFTRKFREYVKQSKLNTKVKKSTESQIK